MVNEVTISANKTELTFGEKVTITIDVRVESKENELDLMRDGKLIKTWKNVYDSQTITYTEAPPTGTHQYQAILVVGLTPPPIPPPPVPPIEPMSRGL